MEPQLSNFHFLQAPETISGFETQKENALTWAAGRFTFLTSSREAVAAVWGPHLENLTFGWEECWEDG